MKKIFSCICIILLISSISYNVLAVNNYNIEVKNKEITKEKIFNGNQGTLKNKVIDVNSKTSEIRGEISFLNTVENTSIKQNDTEIFIMIPESIVLTEDFPEYASYISTFSEKVFDKNSSTKIGIIGIKGTINSSKVVDGKTVWGDDDEGYVPGREEDAEILVNPTNDVEKLNIGISNMNSEEKNYNVNLQAAIRLANKSYSEDVNKILISLYDNVPRIAIGVPRTVQGYEGGVEEAVRERNQLLVDLTKGEIDKLQENKVSFILLRPDDTSYDQKWYLVETGELVFELDGSEYVQQLYGTVEEPNYGKMYSLNDNSLEEIVTEYIYEDIMEEINKVLNNLKITYIFSEEVREYFDITILNNDMTNIEDSELENEGKITCLVEKMVKDDNVSIEYMLKLKDKDCAKILNKEISISQASIEADTFSKLEIESPKIKITAVEDKKENTTNEVKNNTIPEEVDNTIAPGKLPYTGKVVLLVGFILIIMMIGISIKKNIDMKDVK